MSDSGQADEYFSVGDERTETIVGEQITLQIYGFNHDELSTGGYAGITFGMKHLMANMRQMNTNNHNVGAFVNSAMYAYLRDTVLPSLPEEIRTHIKTVNKKTSMGGTGTSVQTNAIQIFLFSVNEVVGTQSGEWVSNNEGSQYPVFSSDASRVKKLSNGAGAARGWWLRSPTLNTTGDFCYVNSGGGSYYAGASGKYGVCFGFCV